MIFIICTSFVFIFLAGTVSSLVAQENIIDKALNMAEEKYTEGRFDEAIVFIKKCLESPNITQKQQQRAYRLMGLTYIAKDYLNEAKNSIEKLLKLVPNYKPDPVYDPPPFINLVEEVQKETVATVAEPEVEPSSKKWWYIGGGIGAVAIVTAIILSSGGEDGPEPAKSLPGPPDLPTN